MVGWSDCNITQKSIQLFFAICPINLFVALNYRNCFASSKNWQSHTNPSQRDFRWYISHQNVACSQHLLVHLHVRFITGWCKMFAPPGPTQQTQNMRLPVSLPNVAASSTTVCYWQTRAILARSARSCSRTIGEICRNRSRRTERGGRQRENGRLRWGQATWGG